MKNCLIALILIGSLHVSASEIVLGTEAPDCVGKPALTEQDVKCIVFFYAKFSSTINPLGGTWEVIVKKQGNVWLVYPETPTKEISENKVLYQISVENGKPILTGFVFIFIYTSLKTNIRTAGSALFNC